MGRKAGVSLTISQLPYCPPNRPTPTPGEATQSRKGYQLRSNLSGAVAVASQDGYKKGGCPVIISSQRGAVIVLTVNIVHQITIIFVLIIHKDSHKYTLVGKTTKMIDN